MHAALRSRSLHDTLIFEEERITNPNVNQVGLCYSLFIRLILYISVMSSVSGIRRHRWLGCGHVTFFESSDLLLNLYTLVSLILTLVHNEIRIRLYILNVSELKLLLNQILCSHNATVTSRKMVADANKTLTQTFSGRVGVLACWPTSLSHGTDADTNAATNNKLARWDRLWEPKR